MLKFYIASSFIIYIYFLICAHDIEKEFINRYNRKPLVKHSFVRKLNSLFVCFIPIYNFIMLFTLIFCYDEVMNKAIQTVLDREAYNI